MINHFSFRIFLICLFSCAALAIGGIWFGENTLPEQYFKAVATLFIIGLASFLIWFSSTLLAIRKAREDK